ncbi:hypothetical protein M758_3G055300 [Ceratodon purpureus]|uniref:Uncharacterized protein n=1 Tax=Ceratodon purpureus TaxID=3225 RepID=A0A8T0GZ41_CERPU|nr:hypothetical protein KC19_N035500 [Ceratodon purpureus]KAG0565091.1 hypothetical protein KC19_8G163400 [Ceratodon purpureus]KAG0582354.1 hypothetical protein KC19_3G053500 [Ceratodon purpureus]KAG0621879.1 hypothetical protein M758_3G055300 [Ceratodon purpureus]
MLIKWSYLGQHQLESSTFVCQTLLPVHLPHLLDSYLHTHPDNRQAPFRIHRLPEVPHGQYGMHGQFLHSLRKDCS